MRYHVHVVITALAVVASPGYGQSEPLSMLAQASSERYGPLQAGSPLGFSRLPDRSAPAASGSLRPPADAASYPPLDYTPEAAAGKEGAGHRKSGAGGGRRGYEETRPLTGMREPWRHEQGGVVTGGGAAPAQGGAYPAYSPPPQPSTGYSPQAPAYGRPEQGYGGSGGYGTQGGGQPSAAYGTPSYGAGGERGYPQVERPAARPAHPRGATQYPYGATGSTGYGGSGSSYGQAAGGGGLAYGQRQSQYPPPPAQYPPQQGSAGYGAGSTAEQYRPEPRRQAQQGAARRPAAPPAANWGVPPPPAAPGGYLPPPGYGPGGPTGYDGHRSRRWWMPMDWFGW